MESIFVESNGLKHHVLIWGEGRRDDVLILHGYLDCARSFTEVAEALEAGGHRVIVPDLRGFGLSDRVPRGAYYHFPDYVADVKGVVESLIEEPFHIVGHSMGGAVATLFAGTFPASVRSLATLEGVGIPSMPVEDAPKRFAQWIRDVRRTARRGPRRMKNLGEVVDRMRLVNPDVPDAILHKIAPRLVRRVDEGLEFLFDPLHQTTSPKRFDEAEFMAFAARLTCPVLHIGGNPPGKWPELEARAQRYPSSRFVRLPTAGHMMHWTQPEKTADVLLSFMADPSLPGADGITEAAVPPGPGTGIWT